MAKTGSVQVVSGLFNGQIWFLLFYRTYQDSRCLKRAFSGACSGSKDPQLALSSACQVLKFPKFALSNRSRICQGPEDPKPALSRACQVHNLPFPGRAKALLGFKMSKPVKGLSRSRVYRVSSFHYFYNNRRHLSWTGLAKFQ